MPHTDYTKTTFVLDNLSCQPELPSKKNDIASNGMNLQTVRNRIVLNSGVSPFSSTTFVLVINLPSVLPVSASEVK